MTLQETPHHRRLVDRMFEHGLTRRRRDRAVGLVIHWHSGSHTVFTIPKLLSGPVAHKTTLEDLEFITCMA